MRAMRLRRAIRMAAPLLRAIFSMKTFSISRPSCAARPAERTQLGPQASEQQIAKKRNFYTRANGLLKTLHSKRRARDRLCRYAQWYSAIAPPRGRSHADRCETTVARLAC